MVFGPEEKKKNIKEGTGDKQRQKRKEGTNEEKNKS